MSDQKSAIPPPMPPHEAPPPAYSSSSSTASGAVTYLIHRPKGATMCKVATVISRLDAADEANLETIKEEGNDYEENSSDDEKETETKLGISTGLQRVPSAESFTGEVQSPSGTEADLKEQTWGAKDAYKQINAPNSRWAKTVRLVSPTEQNVAEISYLNWQHTKAAVMNFQRFGSAGTRPDVEFTRVKKTTRAHSMTTPDGKTYTFSYEGKWKDRNIVCRLKQAGEDIEVARVTLNGSVWGTILAHGDRRLTINRDLVPEEVAIAGVMVMLRHERNRRRAYWASTSHGGS